jgi:hypothetical protein
MVMTREQAMRERNHKEWLSHPEWWESGATHVRKRDNSLPGIPYHTGLIHKQAPLCIYLLEYVAGVGCRLGRRLDFNTLEDLLAEGWEVD